MMRNAFFKITRFLALASMVVIVSCKKTLPPQITDKLESSKSEHTFANDDVSKSQRIKSLHLGQTNYKVGDTVIFGHYFQSNIEIKEPIQWNILEIDSVNHKMLLLSKYVIDVQPYHKTNTQITWESSSLRTWLNNIFINQAFTETEQKKIQMTHLDNQDNPFQVYGTSTDNPTCDKIFLLSFSDVYGENSNSVNGTRYFNNNNDRKAMTTWFSVHRGIFAYNSETFQACSTTNHNLSECSAFYWLRSTGVHANLAMCIQYGGSIYHFGESVNNDVIGVRPALWVSY